MLVDVMVIEKPNIQCNDIGNEIATGCLDFFLFLSFFWFPRYHKQISPRGKSVFDNLAFVWFTA